MWDHYYPILQMGKLSHGERSGFSKICSKEVVKPGLNPQPGSEPERSMASLFFFFLKVSVLYWSIGFPWQLSW